jgi:transcriptional regulator with XRE-family HTH domain
VPGRGPDQVDKHIGKRIRLRRLMLNLSQTDVADALGLTFQQIQKYEKGSNRLSAGRLLRVAILLEVPLTYFYQDAPGVSGLATKVAIPEFVTDMLMTSSGIALARAFGKVQRTALRRRIINFVDAIGDDEVRQRKRML